MEAVQLLQVSSVQGPCLRTIEVRTTAMYTANHAAEVFEEVNRLQLGAINSDGGSVGNCGRCWLKQDICLAEADRRRGRFPQTC